MRHIFIHSALRIIVARLLSTALRTHKSYLTQKRRLYFLECFYFSVVTVTTLGYGDITPNFWFVKLAASIQSLLGVAIVAIGFGLIVNRIHQKRLLDDSELD